ncbi:MAG: hypothetical protein AAF940_10190, partial [Pseudomonadota bacterium]
MGLKKIAAAAALVTLAPVGSWATDIPFTASVTSTCTIVIVRDGRLYNTNGGTVMRSNTRGGNARVNVFTNSTDFALSVDSPPAFDLQPVDDIASPETFVTQVSGRRDTRFNWTTGPASLNPGETR